ncbi:MAG: peptidylprolyl isomerase [Gammaproteobacteria bacterium]|nr:peptidylprolyl isomerase [Gammaproteobacteria bacterium]
MASKRVAVLLISCGLALLNVSARADYVELDAIVAVVDDDVVLSSELLSRLKRIREQFANNSAQLPSNDVLVSQLMERLVLESLQIQEAERRGVQVGDEDLTRYLTSVSQQNNMNLDQFRAALQADGVSYVEFREQIRKEMLIQRLQRNHVNRRITISDQDIDDMLNSPYYQQLLSDEFRVGHILLAIDDRASPEVKAEAQASAIEIVRELREGADFAEMAIARSAGARALEGGDLGWRRAGELPTLFADQVMALEPGQTANPVASASGIHIVQLLEQRGAGMQREQQALLRHILVRPSEIRTELQTEELIREIYARLQAGEDFIELAAEHSEDPTSALNGGDLGWTGDDGFSPAISEAMNATATGSLSEPFRSQYGWHVLEVQERREQDLSEETRRNMATQLLHNRRFDEELQAWLKELRDEAFVEMRL